MLRGAVRTAVSTSCDGHLANVIYSHTYISTCQYFIMLVNEQAPPSAPPTPAVAIIQPQYQNECLVEACVWWRLMSGGGSCLVEAHVWWRLMSGGGSCLAHVWWRFMSGGGSCLVEDHVWRRLMSGGGSCLVEARVWYRLRRHSLTKCSTPEPNHNHRIFDHRFFGVLTNTLI